MCSGDNQSVGLSVLVVSRWLWSGNRIFLEVAGMVVTWWIVACCAVLNCTFWFPLCCAIHVTILSSFSCIFLFSISFIIPEVCIPVLTISVPIAQSKLYWVTILHMLRSPLPWDWCNNVCSAPLHPTPTPPPPSLTCWFYIPPPLPHSVYSIFLHVCSILRTVKKNTSGYNLAHLDSPAADSPAAMTFI